MPKDSAMIPTDRTEAIHNLARCPRGISPPFQPSRSRIPKTPFLMSDSTGFISTSEPKQWQDSSSLRAMRHIRNEETPTSTSAVVQFVGFLRHLREVVVGLVAVHKAVGHDEINDIRRGERLAHAAAFTTGVDSVRPSGFLLVLGEGDTVGARLLHVHIRKEIVGTLGVVLRLRYKP